MVIDINHLYSSLILRGVVVGAGFSTSVDHEQVAMIAVELQDEITKLLAALGQQGQHTIGTPFEISIAAKFHHVLYILHLSCILLASLSSVWTEMLLLTFIKSINFILLLPELWGARSGWWYGLQLWSKGHHVLELLLFSGRIVSCSDYREKDPSIVHLDPISLIQITYCRGEVYILVPCLSSSQWPPLTSDHSLCEVALALSSSWGVHCLACLKWGGMSRAKAAQLWRDEEESEVACLMCAIEHFTWCHSLQNIHCLLSRVCGKKMGWSENCRALKINMDIAQSQW